MVGGVPGTGDDAGVDAVEDPAFGVRVAAERFLAGDHRRLDVVAARVAGGHENVARQSGSDGAPVCLRARAFLACVRSPGQRRRQRLTIASWLTVVPEALVTT